jgi:23S rRNA pseudouridine2605 synthase
MAKSARGSGKRGETHYNRKEEGKNFNKSGDRKPRFGDRDSDRRPARKEEGDRKPAFRKREDEQGFKPRRESTEGRKPFRKDEGGDRPFERKPFTDKKDFKPQSERPFKKRAENSEDRERRPYRERKEFRQDGDRPFKKRDDSDVNRERKPARRFDEGDKKPFARKRDDAGSDDRRKSFNRQGEKPFKRRTENDRDAKSKTRFDREEFAEHSNPGKPGKWNTEVKEGPMTLNKYLAHAGISSRRDAAAIIKEGKVQVNGKVLTEPGYRVQPGDKVTMDGKALKPQKHFVYVLLNKPKDFITTTEDDRGRRTVMELVSGATEDRLYPVGRLDRNTTGVLLLTNDGDLAQKLSHPKYESKKIYQVSLDKELTKRDFDKILEGVELEDGMANVDRLAYLDKKSEIGLEIHSGRNRIVRRIFESLGYQVEKLDRVMYAGLTKKNVSRGKWRFLTEKEVIALKHFRT